MPHDPLLSMTPSEREAKTQDIEPLPKTINDCLQTAKNSHAKDDTVSQSRIQGALRLYQGFFEVIEIPKYEVTITEWLSAVKHFWEIADYIDEFKVRLCEEMQTHAEKILDIGVKKAGYGVIGNQEIDGADAYDWFAHSCHLLDDLRTRFPHSKLPDYLMTLDNDSDIEERFEQNQKQIRAVRFEIKHQISKFTLERYNSLMQEALRMVAARRMNGPIVAYIDKLMMTAATLLQNTESSDSIINGSETMDWHRKVDSWSDQLKVKFPKVEWPNDYAQALAEMPYLNF